jgi:teichoic acid transport system permease protein
MRTVPVGGADDDYVLERHVYEPHRAGLPKFGPYVRALWRRREFGFELSRSSLRAAHFGTVFGQLWLVISPLLLGAVYFVLVAIISGQSQGAEFFAHLLAGLFVFYFIAGAMTAGSKSVVGGGRLIMNMAFPRVLLPLSSVLTAFMRFLPTMAVLVVVGAIARVPIGAHLLLALPLLAFIVVFASGMAMVFATLQVYFRDTSNFLPYFTRMWLYLSPVLYYIDQVPEGLRPFSAFNPLFWLIGAWGELLVRGNVPSATVWLGCVLWSVGTFVVGWLFLTSREREFAVRI